ncbi:hypothetical protein H5J25_13700 [Sphingomonas aliaeris]|uniref:Lipoprotein n=1 Tax=Sphingomonas aliaeris TaxID=2759526 RepID=A0A974NT71_9SPHN|nr:hypothetical protein [Sphingomonas aliaeris]QQV76499.1 hypothetical protein H5J25_13700 [Sphingomonas aliaeris]
MKGKMLLAAAAAALSGCDAPSVSADPQYSAKVDAGIVALAATAPDGTKLWAVTPPGSGRRVYFSSGGTQTSHSESCGKNCTRLVDEAVPVAQ